MNLNSISFSGILKTSQKTITTTDDNDRLLVFATGAVLGASKPDDFNEVSRKDGLIKLQGQIGSDQALNYLLETSKEVPFDKESLPVVGDKLNVVVTKDSVVVECKDKFNWKVEKNNTNGLFGKYGDIYQIISKISQIF